MRTFIRVTSEEGFKMYINVDSIVAVYEATNDLNELCTVVAFANLYEPVKESVDEVLNRILEA